MLRLSAPPVCHFSPRISPVCAFLRLPTAFLLLCSRVVGLPLLPFRVYFSSLAAAKGFVLLKIRARRLAPLVVIVRGAQLFLAFLSVVFLLAAPFSVRRSRVFRGGCRVFVPVCGLFRSQGLRFSRFNACFRHLVWGFGGFAQRFRGLTPRCSGAVHRFASVRCGAVEKRADFPLIHNLFSTVFSTVWRKCPPSRAFSTAFPFFLHRVHRAPPAEGRKSPLHARVYII